MTDVSVPVVSERLVRAVVNRADGRVEDLGLIAYYSRNPLKRWAYRFGRLLGLFSS